MDVATQIKAIQTLLTAYGLPRTVNQRQTALCLLALLDTKPREGLLPGKRYLNDGARIHDIMEFVRRDVGQEVAENTRESYRKQSLKPLLDKGLLTITRSAINDPNTHYKLNREFEATLRRFLAGDEDARAKMMADLLKIETAKHSRVAGEQVEIHTDGEVVVLSPGAHNKLEKAIIEEFMPAFVDSPVVLYIGDAAHKLRFVHPFAAKLGIALDEHAKAPDVILYSRSRNIVYVVEAVTSVGPVTEARLRDIEQGIFPRDKTFGVEYFTACPDRRTLRRFVEDIAWGTNVWIANEPFGLIVFRRYR